MPPVATSRPALDALVRASGLAPHRVRLVARLDCEVYRIEAADARGVATSLSLRVYPGRKADRAPIDAELAWLRALADDGQHVPRPLADEDGTFLRTWQPDPATPPRHAVLLGWLDGRMHDRGLTPERLRRVGRLTGRMHELSARLVREGAIATSREAVDDTLADWAAGTRARMDALPARLRTGASRVAAALARDPALAPRDAASRAFLHGDLHPWNLLFADTRAGAIDFSDCGWGPRAFDLASTLQWLRHPWAGNHDHGLAIPRLQDALLDGYATTSTLPPDVERQVDVNVLRRLLMTLEWMLDDWPGLAHRAWGPRFLAACEGVFERVDAR